MFVFHLQLFFFVNVSGQSVQESSFSCFFSDMKNSESSHIAGQETEIVIAAPRAVEKHSKIIGTCSAMVADAMGKMNAALKMAADDPSIESLQIAYETTCVVRLHVLEIWGASSVDEIPNQQVLPSGKLKSQTQEAVKTEKMETEAPKPELAQKSSESAPTMTTSPTKVESAGSTVPESKPSPGLKSSAGESGAASSAASSGKKITQLLVKQLTAGGRDAQHVKEFSHVLCKVHMQEIIGSFMDCETVADLNAKVAQLKNAQAVVKDLKDGANKAATSLKSHITARTRALSRKRQQEQKNLEQTEVKKSRKQAQEAAEQLKNQEKVQPPIFKVNWIHLLTELKLHFSHALMEVEGPAKGTMAVDEPCIIKNLTALTDFLKNPKASCKECFIFFEL